MRENYMVEQSDNNDLGEGSWQTKERVSTEMRNSHWETRGYENRNQD